MAVALCFLGVSASAQTGINRPSLSDLVNQLDELLQKPTAKLIMQLATPPEKGFGYEFSGILFSSWNTCRVKLDETDPTQLLVTESYHIKDRDSGNMTSREQMLVGPIDPLNILDVSLQINPSLTDSVPGSYNAVITFDQQITFKYLPAVFKGKTVKNIRYGFGFTRQQDAEQAVALLKAIQNIACPVKLTKATSLDGSRVTVDFSILGRAPKTYNLQIYRANKPFFNPDTYDPDVLTLGGTNVAVQNLRPGQDYSITVANHFDLTPDPKKPYIIVVATADNRRAQIYFRKWRLAVVTHGYAGFFKSDRTETQTWVDILAAVMEESRQFDRVLPWHWEAPSRRPDPSALVKDSANPLFNEILSYKKKLAETHPGDVVDLYLVGFSRGTVVVSKVLQQLAASENPGSWKISIVLLDCHPADTKFNHLLSPDEPTVNSFVAMVYDFQNATHDDNVVIPNLPGIYSIQYWWQKTDSHEFPTGSTNWACNLWGLTPELIDNKTNLKVEPYELTNKKLADGRLIGHEQVHEYFLYLAVQTNLAIQNEASH